MVTSCVRHDALRTSVSRPNNFVPIRWLGIRAFRRIAIRRNWAEPPGTPEGWSTQIYEKVEWWACQIINKFRWQVQPFWHNTRVTDVRTTEFQLHMTYALYSIDLLTRVKTSNIRQTSKKAFRHTGRLFETARLRQTKSSSFKKIYPVENTLSNSVKDFKWIRDLL